MSSKQHPAQQPAASSQQLAASSQQPAFTPAVATECDVMGKHATPTYLFIRSAVRNQLQKNGGCQRLWLCRTPIGVILRGDMPSVLSFRMKFSVWTLEHQKLWICRAFFCSSDLACYRTRSVRWNTSSRRMLQGKLMRRQPASVALLSGHRCDT